MEKEAFELSHQTRHDVNFRIGYHVEPNRYQNVEVELCIVWNVFDLLSVDSVETSQVCDRADLGFGEEVVIDVDELLEP